MAARIAHANVQVSDAGASLTFYRRLGLELIGCLRLDPAVLYYVGSTDQPDVAFELADNPSLDARSPGSGHLALAVGDLDALLGELATHGIEPEKPPFNPIEGGPLRVCFVQDPDGNRIELIEGDFPTPRDAPPEGVGRP
jgi:lactoylglutathione lyase